ncbi:Fc.00g014590.m01.CDS01 [Cosmosporella sp. VM-42]
MSAPDERSPLLANAGDATSPTNESSPLLQNNTDPDHEEEVEGDDGPPQRTSWPLWPVPSKARTWRWPSIIAMAVLALVVILIILLGFLVPPAIKDYAEKAAVLEPTNLAIESITSDGVRARIQANVRLDGSRVHNANSRRIGRAATSLMRRLKTEETTVHVYLPDYDDALLGSAVIPSLIVDIVDGHNNDLDFVTDLSAGDAENIRKIANDWLKGNLKQLRVVGKTKINLKSGVFPLGAHDLAELLVFEANKIPSMPKYKIEHLNFHDIPVDSGRNAVAADVSVVVHNDYPVALSVPSLGFEVLVPNCDSKQPSIRVAEASTKPLEIRANEDVKADAEGVIREIPESLTRLCPNSQSSPLDHFMDRYLHGEDAKVFIRGKKLNDSDTPEWIGDIMESITVPIEFPGRSFDNFIRNFSLTDVNFKLPDPFADVDDPNGEPRVSGTALVLAAIPSELNLDLGVESIRATADLFYKKRKMGELNLRDWQKANSTKVDGDGEDLLNITSRVVDAPLTITDGDVFSDVMQKILFGDDDVILDVNADVDVKVSTVLGILTVKKVPAEGKIPVKQLPGDTFQELKPQIGEIRILNTSDTGVRLQASVNMTNPTPYAAQIPYFNIHILQDGVVLGEAVVRDVDFHTGNNTNVLVQATWDPVSFGGKKAHEIGRKLLSKYVSGKNTTLTARTHRGSIPTVPLIGEALSKLSVTLPTPRIRLPGDDSGENQRFIKDATFHIFSSSATFGLISPLQYNTIYIEHINATAFYNHTEPVGQIIHDGSFPAPPGLSETPRLPVIWSADHVGFDKLKEALGGSLKLDAVANVTIRLGNWVETVHYTGKGIGATVRL